MSVQTEFARRYIRAVEKPRLARAVVPEPERRHLNRLARWVFRPPRGVWYRDTGLALGDTRIAAIEATPQDARTDRAILYLHGGAYMIGSPQTHRYLAGALAVAAGSVAVLPDYRLAPEHPFPAAVEDAVTAYRALSARGVDRIALAGDSAGGGLVFALLQQINALDLPSPVATYTLSPWTDLTLSGGSISENEDSDVLIPLRTMELCRSRYLEGEDPKHPLASPLFGAFADPPPSLFQVSRTEVLLDDTLRMAELLRRSGGTVEVQTWADTPHGWHILQGLLPEADEAIAAGGQFLGRHLG